MGYWLCTPRLKGLFPSLGPFQCTSLTTCPLLAWPVLQIQNHCFVPDNCCCDSASPSFPNSLSQWVLSELCTWSWPPCRQPHKTVCSGANPWVQAQAREPYLVQIPAQSPYLRFTNMYLLDVIVWRRLLSRLAVPPFLGRVGASFVFLVASSWSTAFLSHSILTSKRVSLQSLASLRLVLLAPSLLVAELALVP